MKTKEAEKNAVDIQILDDFESIEMAEYEYLISDSYQEPYWQSVKQAILEWKKINE